MIRKERLEKLIKNKRLIYYKEYNKRYPYRWKKGYDTNEKWILRRTFETPQWHYNLTELFGTKKETDWLEIWKTNTAMIFWGFAFGVLKKPLTKDNFLEAVELCRKVFLGKEQ